MNSALPFDGLRNIDEILQHAHTTLVKEWWYGITSSLLHAGSSAGVGARSISWVLPMFVSSSTVLVHLYHDSP